ncbi:MAG TPA: MarR family transcriptional regulator [Sphingomonadales bacterium]|nr:MarR family transcriptional regulator [Sphingomonadales bacterium]
MTTADYISKNCAVLRTRKAARIVSRYYDDAFRSLDIKNTQFSLLVAIKIGAPDSISAFADRMGIERTTLTRNLQLLEKKGFIEVGPEGYRRSRAIHLLPKGQVILEKAIPLWENAQHSIERKLGHDDWHSAKSSLENMAHLL